jgi:hypothetical protein
MASTIITHPHAAFHLISKFLGSGYRAAFLSYLKEAVWDFSSLRLWLTIAYVFKQDISEYAYYL